MEGWQLSIEHPGYRYKTITCGACTITLLKPELDPVERTKRERHLKTVAENVLKNYFRKEIKA